MKLFHMLNDATWPDVKASLLWAYREIKESLESYQFVFARLKQLAPRDTRMRLALVRTFREKIDDEPFVDVVGRDGTRNRDLADFEAFRDTVTEDYANAEADFAISLVPWAEWMGMEVEADTRASFTNAEIVAHALWEMTFHGFEEIEVQKTCAEISRRAEELRNMSEEERKRLRTSEEVLAEIRAKLGQGKGKDGV